MIECRNISKTYISGDNKTEVLKDVSFGIEAGEFVSIMGPSGSGKSTLMHILGALDSPTSGQYLLEGSDVSNLNDDELAEVRKNKIGFVFQAFNLLPRANVLRNVALPLIYSETRRFEREDAAKNALVAAGMDPKHFGNLSNQLSGGQMQRVAIARALVNNPKIILADEPTGNLDSKTGEVVMQTFRQLNSQGRTIIVITHEKEIAMFAKRILHIRDGQIIKDEMNSNEI